jgi:hypothetical protein
VSHAQGSAEQARQRIQGALDALRLNSPDHVTLFVDNASDRGTPVTIRLYLKSTQINPQRELFQLDYQEFRGNPLKLNQRVVADGVTIWSYNQNRNEYSSAIYGRYAGPQPQDYRDQALNALNASVTSGIGSYMARLVQQTYGGVSATYRHWIAPSTYPTPQPTIDANGVHYWLGPQAQPRRTLDFFIPGQDLQSIVYREANPAGVPVDAVIVPHTEADLLTQPGLFIFQPPAGAKPVAFAKPVTGG